MTVFYWLIPLFVVAVAVAVIPVLYGTLKHADWERREEALKEHQSAQLKNAGADQLPQIHERSVRLSLQDARAEAAALLQRIEHLTEQVEGDSGANISSEARSMATAGHGW